MYEKKKYNPIGNLTKNKNKVEQKPGKIRKPTTPEQKKKNAERQRKYRQKQKDEFESLRQTIEKNLALIKELKATTPPQPIIGTINDNPLRMVSVADVFQSILKANTPLDAYIVLGTGHAVQLTETDTPEQLEFLQALAKNLSQ